ncbi:MAG TPA: hypothetical protein VFQ61_35190 [Polyangiaceae bacterium]|nr:hypothetical protein [Polyangiaceae bacterium]
MADPKQPSEREIEADEAASNAASSRESEPTDSNESDSNESEPAETAEGELAGSADRPTPMNRAEARKAARSKGGSEDIRDRNKRVREEAAARRRSRRDAEERVVQARNLDASEIVDDALARTTQAAGNFLKRHINTVQWLIVLGVVSGIGYQIWSYRHHRTTARTADELAKALVQENARVGAEPAENQESAYYEAPDPRPSFTDDAARLKAAGEQYSAVKSSTSGKISTLAALGLAGVLYDQGKFKAARDEYTAVKGSELAKLDNDVRGRSLEGIGLTLEAEQQIDAALAAFRELENTDVPGLSALGQYHQARLLLKKGEREPAKKLLTQAQEKLKKLSEAEQAGPDQLSARGGFLEHQVRELLITVDPSAAPKAPAGGLSPEQIRRLQSQLGGGDGKMDPAKLKELLEKLSKPATPGSPPAGDSTPAPAGSAP